MHRIGHVDILIDHGDIRREYAKKAVTYNTRRRGACSNVLRRTANTYAFWYFAKLTVARRLRASFFGGKQPLLTIG
jgi:hypothetical protein